MFFFRGNELVRLQRRDYRGEVFAAYSSLDASLNRESIYLPPINPKA